MIISRAIHGNKEPVSTGSQAQYPPQSNTVYAQSPPSPIPIVPTVNDALAQKI